MKYHHRLNSSERNCERKLNETFMNLGVEALDALPKPEHWSACTEMASEAGAIDQVSLNEDKRVVFT